MIEAALEAQADFIINNCMQQFDLEEVSDLLDKVEPGDYFRYQNDPVGFCEEVLGETLTPDIKLMMESVRDNMVTVAISGNATGKSHGAARVAVWFYVCFPNCKVFTAAAPPLDNLKNILWGEIGSVVNKHPDLFTDHAITFLDIRQGPEDFLTGVAIPAAATDKEARFSGKPQDNMRFIFDEGDAIPSEVYSGAESCMSGGHVRELIMFNPRMAAGEVFRMIRDHEASIVHLSAMNHPNVITGEEIILGAVTRGTTIRRVNDWTRPLVDCEKVEKEQLYDLPAFLVGQTTERKGGGEYLPLKPGKYVIRNPAFAYMVLGRYPAQGTNQLISREWVSRARARWDIYVAKYGEVPPEGTEGIMGLDVADFGDDYNAACARYGGYVTSFLPERDTWGGIDVIETGSRAHDWYNSHPRITSCKVDATGLGSGVAPQMQRLGCVATSVKAAASPTFRIEIGTFRHLRDQLWWQVREWLRTDPGAMLPPDEEMIEELTAPIYEINEKGEIVVSSQDDLKEILKRSPNKADALRQTFAGEGEFFDDSVYLEEPPDAVAGG